jgi:uncharacterized protein with PIN domain
VEWYSERTTAIPSCVSLVGRTPRQKNERDFRKGNAMRCPDCKVEMETISHNYIGEAIEPYYKCLKCGIEIDEEE